MKKAFFCCMTVWLGIAGSLCGVAAAEPPSNEWVLNFAAHFPGTGDFDLYKSGLGAELQYRNWALDPFGWAIAAGYSSWEADKNCKKLGDIHRDFDGSVSTIPLGLSGLMSLYASDTWGLVLELGVRYVFTDSDVDFTRVVGDKEIPSSLEVKDSVLGLAVLEADYKMGEQLLLFGGVGYQQDIVRGEIETPTGNLRDNEFTSLFLRLGAKWLF